MYVPKVGDNINFPEESMIQRGLHDNELRKLQVNGQFLTAEQRSTWLIAMRKRDEAQMHAIGYPSCAMHRTDAVRCSNGLNVGSYGLVARKCDTQMKKYASRGCRSWAMCHEGRS